LQPLQGDIQATIDQRFSRCKYDVARMLAAFSAALRHEIAMAPHFLLPLLNEQADPAEKYGLEMLLLCPAPGRRTLSSSTRIQEKPFVLGAIDGIACTAGRAKSISGSNWSMRLNQPCFSC